MEDLLPEFVNNPLYLPNILVSATGFRKFFLEVFNLLLEEYKVGPYRLVGVVVYLLPSVLVLGYYETLSVYRTLDSR